MNLLKLNAFLFAVTFVAGSCLAQNSTTDPQAASTAKPESAQNDVASKGRADAYFNYTMGHIAEKQYEETSRSEYATQAIEYYKKAYALDPKSPVIGERLAEMYWKAQRVHEAELEAQALLKRNPEDAQTRRFSSYDRTGGNDDRLHIEPGETVTIAEHQGAGVVTHIWATLACKSENFLRKIVLHAYWDGSRCAA